MEDFFDSNYYLNLDVSDLNSSSNASCPQPMRVCTNDSFGYEICIESPTLIPTCILALIIGLTCSIKLSKLPGAFPTRWFYSLTFFLFGMMMTSAGILHCIIGDIRQSESIDEEYNLSMKFIQFLFSVIDVGLTTNIAVSFFFCGLCDIRLLNPASLLTRFLLIISYFIVFTLWALGILNNWTWTFHVLYVGVIAVGCSIYFLTQLCLKRSRRALPLLLIAGVYGAVGLYIASYGAQGVCESEGTIWAQYIGPEFIWFLFSDIAMAFVYLFVSRANVNQQEENEDTNEIDLEKPPIKF